MAMEKPDILEKLEQAGEPLAVQDMHDEVHSSPDEVADCHTDLSVKLKEMLEDGFVNFITSGSGGLDKWEIA